MILGCSNSASSTLPRTYSQSPLCLPPGLITKSRVHHLHSPEFILPSLIQSWKHATTRAWCAYPSVCAPRRRTSIRYSAGWWLWRMHMPTAIRKNIPLAFAPLQNSYPPCHCNPGGPLGAHTFIVSCILPTLLMFTRYAHT